VSLERGGGRRPPKIAAMIAKLLDLAATTDRSRDALTLLAIDARELGVDTSEFVGANHDLEHAWRHVTAARRALRMAWPTEDGDPDE
jgi:hypothetical protein